MTESTPSNLIVEMKGIVKRFPGVLANDHVDFELRAGEIHALLGENGAGKSTLMNVLAGLYKQDAGIIKVKGKTLEFSSPRDAINAGIGMVHDFAMPSAPELVKVLPVEVSLTRAFWLIRHADDRRIDRMNRHYRDIKPGDRYALTFIPGRGTELSLNGTALVTIEGDDFAAAYCDAIDPIAQQWYRATEQL